MMSDLASVSKNSDASAWDASVTSDCFPRLTGIYDRLVIAGVIRYQD